jgi:hypothetical protein
VSTIFGFNTDTKVGDTVYHVQSEARENDLLLQTQVFVKGHCIGKRASSYAERTVQPGFSIELMHELLKAQHRMMLEAVRESRAEALFCSDGAVQDVNAGGMAIQWTNATEVFAGDKAVLKLIITRLGEPVDGALVTSRTSFEPDAHIHSQGMSETDGKADIEIELPVPPTGNETPVLIRAATDDKSVTRKFRIKRA